MRIAICDDEKADLDILSNALNAYDTSNHLQVDRFSNSTELLSLAQAAKYALVILDIEMPAPNGYDTALKLLNMPHRPLIIFLTNSMAYTVRGYGVAFRYLPKPISQEYFNRTLDAAIREIRANRFMFSVDGASHILAMEAIYYMEVFNHTTVLHTVDYEYTFRATLKDVLSQLPSGYFGMPHQSYIVNFSHVKTATINEIHMTNGVIIPVSRRRQKEFEQQLYTYLGR